MSLVPIVIVNESGKGERSFDIFSRLLQERIVILNDEVNDVTSGLIIAQMLHLEKEDPNKDIIFYINSPGGSISAGLAIYDTMEIIQCDVQTIGMGSCASMGAFLLAAGAKGKRQALPNCEVMIHQPLGGARGQASDIAIQAEHMARTKAKMNRLLAQFTGKEISIIEKDTDRDNYKSAEEALEYGLIDIVLKKTEVVPNESC